MNKTLAWTMFWSFWTITEYHRLGVSNNKYLFFTILEAGKSKIKALADSLSNKDQLSDL